MNIFKQKPKHIVKKEEKNQLRYEDPKSIFFDEYLNLSKSLQSWKIGFFTLCALLAFTLSITLYLSTRSIMIPYVIEVDQTGNAKAINPAYKINYNPKEMQVEYFLKQFIRNSRNLYLDNKFEKQMIQQNLFFLSKKAQAKYAKLLASEGVSKMLREQITRRVNIISIIKRTKSTYQVRWVEKTFNKEGAMINKENIIGYFTVEIITPKTIKQIDINPLGIIFTDFSISKEH